MRTFIKIAAVAAAAAMLGIIAVAFLAKIYITPQRVRSVVLPAAEKSLKREVQLGDISFSLFSGINLHDLRIKNRGSEEIFIATSRASLRYQLLPLLFMRIVIDEVRLEEPQISITRLPGGDFNFSDLLAAGETQRPEGESPSDEQPASTQDGPLPISLTIASVSINKGIVIFTDAADGADTPTQYRISHISGSARSITLDQSFPFDFSCQVNGAPLSIAGDAGLSEPTINARIKLKDFDAVNNLPRAADTLPDTLTSLIADMTAQVQANPEQITSKGTLTLHDIDLTDPPIRDAQLELDFDFIVDMQKSLLQIGQARINYNGSIAELSGKIASLDSKPNLSIDARIPELDIDALLNLPSSPKDSKRDHEASRALPKPDTPAREMGPFDIPIAANGTVAIDMLVYKGLPVRDFRLRYRLADNILLIKEISGQTAEGSFSQSGRVDLGRTGIPYTGTLNIQGLQIDPVVSAFLPSISETLFGSLNATVDIDGRGTLPQSIKKNLTCNMKINLDHGRISGAQLSRGLAEFLNIDELRDLTFNSFSGTVNIKQGRALLDTALDSDRMRMAPRGTVGLDGVLDLSLATFLGPDLLKKLDKSSKVTKYLTDKDGWGQLPIMLHGSTAKPKFSLDSAQLIRQTEKNVVETLQEKLFEKIQEADSDSDNLTEEEIQENKKRKQERKAERKKRKAAKKAAKAKKQTDTGQ